MLPEWAVQGIPAGAAVVMALLWYRVAQLEREVSKLTEAVRRLTLVVARDATVKTDLLAGVE